MITNADTTLVDPVRRTTRSHSPGRLVRLIGVRQRRRRAAWRSVLFVSLSLLPTPKLDATELSVTNEEYQVISALFADDHDPVYLWAQVSGGLFGGDFQSVLDYITKQATFCSEAGPDPPLLREILEDQISKPTAILEPRLQIQAPYDLVSEQYRWRQYCPGEVKVTITVVSRVGFDRTRSKALVQYSYGSAGDWVILEKREGRWTVVCRFLAWVS